MQRFSMFRVGCCLLVINLLLAGCTAPIKETVYIPSVPPPVVPEPVQSNAGEFQRARILADMLYSASIALENNKLMLPAGDNAYDRFREVLELDSGNAVALAGIQEIVLRYISLADAATAQGLYNEAESLLARATRLNPDRAELSAARERLAIARLTKVEMIELDPAELSIQSLEMLTRLADIAQRIQKLEATFLINARTDEEGRWIYKTMREAVGGYRLRGNLNIAGTPNILITIPK